MIPKKVGEPLGVVVVESGWGSMLPTVVVAKMEPNAPSARSNQLNIGDQVCHSFSNKSKLMDEHFRLLP